MTYSTYGRLELIRVDDDCWRLCDGTLPQNDPARVIALAEIQDGGVTVLWLRERDGHACFASFEEALNAAEDRIYAPENDRAESPIHIRHFPPPIRRR